MEKQSNKVGRKPLPPNARRSQLLTISCTAKQKDYILAHLTPIERAAALIQAAANKAERNSY